MKIIIADNNAWEKSLDLDKAVVRIGSSAASDVQLASPDIAPVHLQILYLPEELGCRVLNLGSDVKVLRGEYQDVVRSYARAELENGDEIFLGEYRIRLELPFTTKTIQTSPAISAALVFPNTALYSHTPTIGWLTVKNIGEQSPCQFHVSVSGVPVDCVKIDPIPLLYSGAQEDVRIQLFHRGLYPYAGQTELNIRVFAPADYPGEHVLIAQGIYVMPVFEQALDFVDDRSRDEDLAALSVNIPDPDMVAQSAVSPVPSVMPPPPPAQDDMSGPLSIEAYQSISVTPKDEPRQAPPKKVEATPVEVEKVVSASSAAKPMPKPVVIRDVPDDFWDEGE